MSLHYKSNYSKFDQVLQIRIIIYTVSNKHHQIYYELYSQSLIFLMLQMLIFPKKSLIFVDEGSIEDQRFQSPNTPAHVRCAPTTIRNYLGGGQQGTEAPSRPQHHRVWQPQLGPSPYTVHMLCVHRLQRYAFMRVCYPSA